MTIAGSNTGQDFIVRGGDAAGLLARLPARIGDVLRAVAARQPGHPAIVDEGGAWSYAVLADAVAQAGAFLRQAGLRGRDRVLILGENNRAMIAFLLAAFSLDAVAVPVNPKLAGAEVDAICAHAAPLLVIYCLDGSPASRAHAGRHGATVREMPGIGCIGFATSAASCAASGEAVADDLAVLIYTSGSTGRPKGVQLTHRNLLFMATASGEIRRLTPDDRIYIVLPLSHIVALAVLLLGGLMHGATLQLAARFTPQALLHALAAEGVSILLATPALVGMLLEYAGAHGPVLAPRLRIVSVSGAPLDPKTKAAAENLFGLKLHHGYGITECSPTIAQVRPEAPRADLSVGPLLPGMEARLVRNGQVVPPEETGELHVRGPNVMPGYFRAPAETEAVIDAAGWFNTGDLARFEGENLFVVGRTKEMVIRFGFNVYPAEVEAVLATHPSVKACAVIGRAGEGGEALIAFVQPASGAPADAGAVLRHAAARLAPYKRPSHVVFVSEFPSTPSGKLQKQALLALADGLPGAGSGAGSGAPPMADASTGTMAGQ